MQLRLSDIDRLALLLPFLFFLLIGIPLGPITFGHIAMLYMATLLTINFSMLIFPTRREKISRLSIVTLLIPPSFCMACAIALADRYETPQLQTIAWPLIQVVTALGWFIIVYQRSWSDFGLWKLFLMLSILACSATIAFWFYSGLETPFVGFTHHKNNLGIAAFSLIALSAVAFCISLERTVQYLAIFNSLLATVLLYASYSRAAALALIASASLFVLFSVLRKVSIRPVWVIFPILILNILIPITFLQFASKASMTETDPFGRPIYNGRETAWLYAVEGILKRPISGYGQAFAAKLRTYHEEELHAHNLYLAIWYHVGLIGLTIIVAFLTYVWFHIQRGSQPLRTDLLLAIYGGVLLQSSFEVSLFYHHHSFITLWTLIGIGVSYSNECLARR